MAHSGAQHSFYSCGGLPEGPVPAVRPVTAPSAPPSCCARRRPARPVTSTSPLAPRLAGRPLRGGPAAILGSGACAVRSGSRSDGAGAELRREGYGWPGAGGVNGLLQSP
ncbi:CDGSH iron-sulfur domain-containing protein 1 isoform X4 [Onychostruthus taczanowskii]|uniref:CDGSH iron-sulfur domain-containing protein 1 isoform X4 n=1 Tax=Onychostruthus taczanowskii TaxID=356909 RepID=UPI001B805A1B|nr:CDGSH iron-sulfur domain-containing protein 1 isoform X4 [Onychostruthus taczanowskii]